MKIIFFGFVFAKLVNIFSWNKWNFGLSIKKDKHISLLISNFVSIMRLFFEQLILKIIWNLAKSFTWTTNVNYNEWTPRFKYYLLHPSMVPRVLGGRSVNTPLPQSYISCWISQAWRQVRQVVLPAISSETWIQNITCRDQRRD